MNFIYQWWKAQIMNEDTECKVPPPGWFCTRTRGHEPPCAAYPRRDNKEPLAEALRGNTFAVGDLTEIIERYRVLREAEFREHGGRANWQGRCASEMNALMDALEVVSVVRAKQGL